MREKSRGDWEHRKLRVRQIIPLWNLVSDLDGRDRRDKTKIFQDARRVASQRSVVAYETSQIQVQIPDKVVGRDTGDKATPSYDSRSCDPSKLVSRM